MLGQLDLVELDIEIAEHDVAVFADAGTVDLHSADIRGAYGPHVGTTNIATKRPHRETPYRGNSFAVVAFKILFQ